MDTNLHFGLYYPLVVLMLRVKQVTKKASNKASMKKVWFAFANLVILANFEDEKKKMNKESF